MTTNRAIFLLAAIVFLLSACTAIQPDQSTIAQGTAVSSATLPTLRKIGTSTPTSTTAPDKPPLNATASLVATVKPLPTAAAASTAPLVPTETLSPTVTILPTATVSPTMIPEPTAVPAIDSTVVNGIPASEIVIMSDAVRDNVRQIFLRGQQIGRNPQAFSKLGDSVTLTDHYLTRFDSGHYNLGPYTYLQPAIDYYNGSFARYGVASRIGLHAWSIFDPLWANKEWCLPDEHMVACEIRLNNPSVLLIKIGSNDSGAVSAFEKNLRLLLEYSVDNGVIPILATKADRFEGTDDRNNRVIRELAQEYVIPLWDYDRVAGTMPRRGLGGDDVHMTMGDADDYTKPETFERDSFLINETKSVILYEVMLEVIAASDA